MRGGALIALVAGLAVIYGLFFTGRQSAQTTADLVCTMVSNYPGVAEEPGEPGGRQPICVFSNGGGGGGGGGSTVLDAELISFTQFLDDMEDALADSVAESGAPALEVGEPFYLATEPQMEGASVVTIHDQLGGSATGCATVTVFPGSGHVALILELTDGQVARTLDQMLSMDGAVLTGWGTLTIDDATGQSTTLTGGWMYAPASGFGAVAHPDSDPGFIDALGAMLLLPDVDGRGFNLGTIVTFIGNVVRIVVGYILDLFVPYTPPISCSGPLISDGAGQSCENVDIPCRDELSEMCELVGSIPNVSNAFKQCMKGRCGCGGSFRRRLQISCADPDDCGPCSSWGGGYGGCNIGGSQMWYCYPDDHPCVCQNAVFHEMSHSCGTMHSMEYWGAGTCVPDDEPCRIGQWFQDQCAPVSSAEGGGGQDSAQ